MKITFNNRVRTGWNTPIVCIPPTNCWGWAIFHLEDFRGLGGLGEMKMWEFKPGCSPKCLSRIDIKFMFQFITYTKHFTKISPAECTIFMWFSFFFLQHDISTFFFKKKRLPAALYFDMIFQKFSSAVRFLTVCRVGTENWCEGSQCRWGLNLCWSPDPLAYYDPRLKKI